MPVHCNQQFTNKLATYQRSWGIYPPVLVWNFSSVESCHYHPLPYAHTTTDSTCWRPCPSAVVSAASLTSPWHTCYPPQCTAVCSAPVGHETIWNNSHVVCCRCLRMTTACERQCAPDTEDIHVFLSKCMLPRCAAQVNRYNIIQTQLNTRVFICWCV